MTGMQATVRSYDPLTGSGSVLLDDGRELTFPGGALRGSGVRSLRSGQRVQVKVSDSALSALDSSQPAPGAAQITALTVYTLPEAGYLTPEP